LAFLDPKPRNLAILRSALIQNYRLAIWLLFGSLAIFSIPRFLHREDLRVARAPRPCDHKAGSAPPRGCAMDGMGSPRDAKLAVNGRFSWSSSPEYFCFFLGSAGAGFTNWLYRLKPRASRSKGASSKLWQTYP